MTAQPRYRAQVTAEFTAPNRTTAEVIDEVMAEARQYAQSHGGATVTVEWTPDGMVASVPLMSEVHPRPPMIKPTPETVLRGEHAPVGEHLGHGS